MTTIMVLTMVPAMIVVAVMMPVMMPVFVAMIVAMVMVMVMVVIMAITVAAVPPVLAACHLSIKEVVVVVMSHAFFPVPATGPFLRRATKNKFRPCHVFTIHQDLSLLSPPKDSGPYDCFLLVAASIVDDSTF
jgi:hypothetical protein